MKKTSSQNINVAKCVCIYAKNGYTWALYFKKLGK